MTQRSASQQAEQSAPQECSHILPALRNILNIKLHNDPAPHQDLVFQIRIQDLLDPESGSRSLTIVLSITATYIFQLTSFDGKIL